MYTLLEYACLKLHLSAKNISQTNGYVQSKCGGNVISSVTPLPSVSTVSE